MRCRYAPVHDEVRGICDALGLDYDRIATDRAGMLWAGEGMPHRFDACCEISDIARRLRAQCRDVCVPSSKNRQIRLSNFDTLMLTASGRAGAVAAGPPAA